MLNPDGGIDCILFLFFQRQGENELSPEQKRALAYLTQDADYSGPTGADDLVQIQKYFFSHAARRFFAYVATEPVMTALQAVSLIREGLEGDHKGGVLVRMAADEMAQWVAVLAYQDGQMTYFDPTRPENLHTEPEATFLARLCFAASQAALLSHEFVVAKMTPPDAASGEISPNTAIGTIDGRPIVVSQHRGVYQGRDMAVVRARQVAAASYEDSLVRKEGLAHAVYALKELRLQGVGTRAGQVHFEAEAISDLFLTDAQNGRNVKHLTF